MTIRNYMMALSAIAMVACKTDKQADAANADQPKEEQSAVEHNALSEKEQSENWILLFDGSTTNGWHLFNHPDVEPIWEVMDGMLVLDPLNGTGQSGDLVTDATYENYEFTFDWKMNEQGNSGVFINVIEGPEYATTFRTGPEYQLLDPTHVDQAVENKRSGCLYGFSPQLTATDTNPAGQWNHSRIVQKDGKAEFYLNGNLTAQVDFTSPGWKEAIASSNFKDFPDFGSATKGHIALQQWTSNVWFRNIKIREL